MPRTTVAELLAEARARLDRVSPEEAEAAVHDGALLVDIRSEVDRAADGVIPGSLHQPRNALEWRADPASGHDDPRLSADLDRRIVFARAPDLVGGFRAWRAAGLPVERL
jgi:rhodanese-related sulfurtransferase